MSEPTIEITSFHAHVYYDSASREAAARVGQGLGDRFNVQLGRWHDKCVGPHTRVDVSGSVLTGAIQPSCSLANVASGRVRYSRSSQYGRCPSRSHRSRPVARK